MGEQGWGQGKLRKEKKPQQEWADNSQLLPSVGGKGGGLGALLG